MVSHNTDIATRALVVSLKSPCYGKSTAEVVTITGLPKSTVNKIYARAVARGFNPDKKPIIIWDCYLEDAPTKAARPSLQKRQKKQFSQSYDAINKKGKKPVLILPESSAQKEYISHLLQSIGFSRLLASRSPTGGGSQ